MSSLVRINANRANGSKSRGPVTPEGKLASVRNSAHSTGPVTPEGKARVSQNAVKHGLLAKTIVLPDECCEGFEAALAALRDELRPGTYLENEYVEIMAAANWRRKRAWYLETARLTNAIQARKNAQAEGSVVPAAADPVADPLAPTPGDPDANSESPAMQTALAFGDLCDGSSVLQTLHRHEIRLSREFVRHLRLLRAGREHPGDEREAA